MILKHTGSGIGACRLPTCALLVKLFEPFFRGCRAICSRVGMHGHKLANGEKEAAAMRNSEASGRLAPSLVLFGCVVGGLNDEEVPVRSVLVHIELPRSHACLFVCLIAERNELEEFLLLPWRDAVNLNLTLFHGLRRRRGRSSLAMGSCC